MADTRNRREVVDIGKFQPYTHPQYGPGAIREVTYLDGTIERRFFHYDTEKDGEGAPDSGYLVDSKVDPKLRQAWDQAAPPAEARTPARTPEQARAAAATATVNEAAAAKAKREREESEANAALPPNQDPRYETDEARRKRAQDTIDRQGRDAEAARQRTRQEEADDRQRRTEEQNAGTQAANARRAEAAEQRAGREEVLQGRGPNGEDVRVIRNTDGTVNRYEPIAGSATKPGSKPIPKGLEYRPDPDDPADDYGLTAYNNRLEDARRAGLIDYETGKDLLSQAGKAADVAYTSRTRKRDQALTERSQSITQRGQSIGEVASRRASGDDQFKTAISTVDKYAATLLPTKDSGQTVVDAYRALLTMGKGHVESVGGYRDVPEIPPVAAPPQGPRVLMHPGGAIEISPAGAPPPAAPAVAAAPSAPATAAPAPVFRPQPPAAYPGPSAPAPSQAPPGGYDPQAAAAGRSNAAAPAASPAPSYARPDDPQEWAPGASVLGQPSDAPPVIYTPGGNAGPSVQMAPSGGSNVAGLFDPGDHEDYLAELGFDPTERANMIALYRRGVRADHL